MPGTGGDYDPDEHKTSISKRREGAATASVGNHKYEEKLEGGGPGSGYTQDGTVDLRGNPVLRSKRGGWKACSFVIVYEIFERMAYNGIASNLVLYLTKKLHQGTVTSANNVTNWVGTMWITPIIGAYIADAHLGRYWTFLIASLIYLMGMAMLTLTVSLKPLKPPPCNFPNVADCKQASTLQLTVFYTSLYILAFGGGGSKPNTSSIGADQFDEFEPKEKLHKLSFFNWWMFSAFFGTLFANTFLVYIQDNVGWTLGYGLPTIGLAISIIIFVAGTPFYRHKMPTGSPFTKMTRVILTAMKKWKVPMPSDPKQLYELDLDEYTRKGKYRIDSTPSMRFLNKAAVKTGLNSSPTGLCSVTEVEETKQMLRMIPILVTTFVPSVMLAQINTLFVKQGTTLRRNIGSFVIPPASLSGFTTLSMVICVVIYDIVFVKLMRKWTKNPRGVTLLQRMGIGFALHILIMGIASFTERKRLAVAQEHGLVENGGTVPLSIFILLPQFLLMGLADSFLEVAKIEFFYDQAPESMKSLGVSYSTTCLSIGNFLSSVLLTTVSDITKRHHHKGWILNNLNDSRLDYLYAFFAILNFLNIILFLVVTKYYVYRADLTNSVKVSKEDQEMMSKKEKDNDF